MGPGFQRVFRGEFQLVIAMDGSDVIPDLLWDRG